MNKLINQMRSILLNILAITTIASHAQTRLTPGTGSFEKKWIKTQSYQMTWFAMKDTSKVEIGVVSTQILRTQKRLTIITQVKMKNSKAAWVDTTIANLSTLKPLYHSSYNMQRDMVLNFGTTVSGSYYDKMKQQTSVVIDTSDGKYFDSNIYPHLLGWLPLKEGYKQDISIYDYNPSGKAGVLKASITNVSSGTYVSRRSSKRDVWIVRVTDEIGNGQGDHLVYYFDKIDRRLWKLEINVNGRKMMMQREEL
jgi:hypothetical protein